MSFFERLESLGSEIVERIKRLVADNGVESDYANIEVLKIDNDNLNFNLEGGRYLVEVSKNELIDNHGYRYDFFVLDLELLAQIADYFSA